MRTRFRAAFGLWALLSLSPAMAQSQPGLPPQLAPYSGSPVLYLDFWASWCSSCAASFPWLNAMQARYGERLKILAVNVDEDSANARYFMYQHPARFDVLMDPKGQLAAYYDIKGMPSSVILSGDGRLLNAHTGFRSDRTADYEKDIDRALADAGSPERP